MQVQINKRSIEISGTETIHQAIAAAGETLLTPELGDRREWINNERCPLLGLAEVDGLLAPLPVLLGRPVRDGMVIDTQCQAVRLELHRRTQLLVEHNECHFIREWQKVVVVEAENGGHLTLEEWEKNAFAPRTSEPAIVHDPNKCIRCKACIDVCRDMQKVEALSFDENLGVIIDDRRCVRCGQCIHHCPMGATNYNTTMVEYFECRSCPFSLPRGGMREVDDTLTAWHLLHDPSRYCVTEFAPAIRASLGEEFGIPSGELVTGRLYAALRRLGFKQVWDTNFSADLTIMEEGTEFLQRLTTGGVLPMFTSCSPGWVRFTETFFPELLPHLSTAKSPQQMFGSVAKSFAAESLRVAPEAMTVISFMPCTAKKAEAQRPEMRSASHYWRQTAKNKDGAAYPDVDLVLTTRELARLLKMAGIDLTTMSEETADPLLGSYTGAATIFGRTGGVMEAALRTVITKVTGQTPPALEFTELATFDGIKCAELTVNNNTLKVAVAHGLDNARRICESVKTGGEFSQYHFIEIMTCPGGCIAGGGQPIPTNAITKRERVAGLNHDDRDICRLRMSHENPEIQGLYRLFFKEPLSHRSHELLHTTYSERPLA